MSKPIVIACAGKYVALQWKGGKEVIKHPIFAWELIETTKDLESDKTVKVRDYLVSPITGFGVMQFFQFQDLETGRVHHIDGESWDTLDDWLAKECKE